MPWCSIRAALLLGRLIQYHSALWLDSCGRRRHSLETRTTVRLPSGAGQLSVLVSSSVFSRLSL